MIAKTIIIATMFAILMTLGSGLFFLVRDKGETRRTAKSLTMRIGLSMSLFLFLFVAFALGWIQPHSL